MARSFAVFMLFYLVAACSGSDPKAANERNFQAAIQKYLDTAYPKCYFNQNFPASIEFDIGGTRAKLQALARAGLVVEKEESRQEVKDPFGGGKKTVVKSSFHLTDEGRKYYKADVIKTMSGDHIGGFCVGKATVKAVTQFSEPADMFGNRVSKVEYTYTVSDLPNWAKAPEVTAAIDAIKIDATSESKSVSAHAVLVLMNNGWAHEKLLKQ